MPYKNTAHTFTIRAWDSVNGAWKTGDAANITVRGVGDGSEFTPAAPAITEIDSTNAKGAYSVTFSNSENNYSSVACIPTSSTTGIVINMVQWTNECSASLAAILGTALTEGAAGRIAAAFKQFFNIASPAATMDHGILVDTVTTLTNAPADSATLTEINADVDEIITTLGTAGAGLTALGDTRIAHLDADVSTRLPTTSYTAPDNADIASIKSTVDTNLDAKVSTRSSHSAADIWSVGTRTLSSFGTLAADVATAVWGAATRTLSAFGFTVTTDVASDVSDIKTQTDRFVFTLPGQVDASAVVVADKTGYALTSAYDPAKTAAQPGDEMSLSTAGLARMFTQDTGETEGSAVDGSVVKEIVANVQSDCPTAADIRAEIDANSTQLADISGRLPDALTLDGNIKADALKINGDEPVSAFAFKRTS